MPRFSIAAPTNPLGALYNRRTRFDQRPAVGSRETKKVNYSLVVLEQIRKAGLPEPVLEFSFAKDALGREWRADLAYPEDWILIEIEGGAYTRGRHTRGAGYEDDCEKYTTATVMGYRVLRFTTGQVKRGVAVTMLKVMFGLAPLTGEEFKPKKSRRKKADGE